MEVQLVRKLGHTVSFLRMAAIELRRVAERSSTMTAELAHIARQLDLEAEELTQQLPERTRPPVPPSEAGARDAAASRQGSPSMNE